MLPITDTRTFQISDFTIREQPRPDNPAWPQYLIFKDEELIGVQFSRPGLSDCEWHLASMGVYARAAESKQDLKKYGRGYAPSGRPRGRPTNAERARRDAALLDVVPE